MNTKSIVGLFQKNAENLEHQLMDSGLQKDHFLKENTDGELFLFSVRVENEQELETAKAIFTNLSPHQIYEFPFIAENKNRIRDYVNAAAKAQIFSLPAEKKHGHSTDGMNSEVVVGKQ